MTKVEGEISTADEKPGADAAAELLRWTGAPVPEPKHTGHFIVRFWKSAVGKKWVMAVSGVILLFYVLAHMIGTLKVFLGSEEINRYAEWLRDLGEPAFPRTVVLWGLRTVIILAFFFHILAAYQLTRINHRARPVKYQSPRDYAAANFASRTMRWTGILIALFLIYHLLDQTWGPRQPRLRARRRVQQPLLQLRAGAGRDRLHHRQHRARHPHLARLVGDVQQPRPQQPSLQPLEALLRDGLRRAHHRRLREHAPPHRHRRSVHASE